jgi:hypothetical protein
MIFDSIPNQCINSFSHGDPSPRMSEGFCLCLSGCVWECMCVVYIYVYHFVVVVVTFTCNFAEVCIEIF